jgi:hypothetical protein
MIICFMDFVGFPLLTIFLPVIFKPFGFILMVFKRFSFTVF